MSSSSGNDSALGQLQSAAQAELLDAIDQLRSDGFSRELNLPQLIVCGDQSSGKSSVLEAISRVRFPASDIFCTRFASELKLRSVSHDSEIHISARIQPASDRHGDEKARLLDFEPTKELNSLKDLPGIIEEAGGLLRELEPDRNIFEDKLLAEIRMPGLPNLTLVDLPGLIHASSKDQTQKDIDTVRKLVESYMADENSIILAILAADNNFANQIVLQLAKNVDESGRRTLGIITKPDKMDRGSESENCVIQCAKNLHVNLELGWHVLKNRSYDESRASAEERDQIETQWFEKHPKWRELREDDRGASTLRRKLSHILLRAIGRSLPSLVQDIKLKIAACKNKSKLLGEAKETEFEQRTELREISGRLRDLVEAGIRGDYLDSFFDHSSAQIESVRRLRARIRDIVEAFEDHIQSKGAAYTSDGSSSLPSDRESAVISFSSVEPVLDIMSPPKVVLPEKLLAAIRTTLQESRGCELPGIIPMQVILKIFRAFSRRWMSIADWYADVCSVAAAAFFKQAVEASAADHIAMNILTSIANPFFESNRSKLGEKLAELMQPYQSGFMITLNTTGFTALLDEANTQRAAEFQSNGLNDDCAISTAWKVADYVQCYYKIAIKTFIENFAALAIENSLVKNLDTIFTSKTIDQMTPEDVRRLTIEPQHVINDRRANRGRLSKLEKALQVCNRHIYGLGTDYIDHDMAGGREQLEQANSTNNTPLRNTFHADQNHIQETLTNRKADSLKVQGDPGYPTPPRTPNPPLPAETPVEDNNVTNHRRVDSAGPQSSEEQKEQAANRSASKMASHGSPTRQGHASFKPRVRRMQDLPTSQNDALETHREDGRNAVQARGNGGSAQPQEDTTAPLPPAPGFLFGSRAQQSSQASSSRLTPAVPFQQSSRGGGLFGRSPMVASQPQRPGNLFGTSTFQKATVEDESPLDA